MLLHKSCLEAFEAISKWQKEADEFFSNKEILDLYYEDILIDYSGKMKEIQEFLNVKIRPVKTPLKKQSRLPLSQAISNYDELKSRFSGTKWEAFFEPAN